MRSTPRLPLAGMLSLSLLAGMAPAEPAPSNGEGPTSREGPAGAAAPDGPRAMAELADLRLRVVDEQGAPLPRFEAMAHAADAGGSPWAAGRDGVVPLGGFWARRGAAPLDVVVRADGFAPTLARFAGPRLEGLRRGEAAITLRRGRPVRVRFKLPEGMTWPGGALPEAYFDDQEKWVRIMRQPGNRPGGVAPDMNMVNLREAGAGRFEFRLAEDTPRFRLAVHRPGFLRFFEAGPFALSDAKGGELEVDVPRPAALEASFAPGDRPAAEGPYGGASLQVRRQLEGNSYLDVAAASDASSTPRLELTDLAPGRYLVLLSTQPGEGVKPLPGSGINLGAYFDQRPLTLGAGQAERIEFRPTPFDPDGYRGERTAIVKIRTVDGEPARGRNASVSYLDPHYGARTVFSGAVPDSGDIVLTGLTDRPLPSWFPFPPYAVSVGDKRVGGFALAGEPGPQAFEFTLVPAVGGPAPDLELTSLASGKPTRLRDLRGKVVLLEFWATWCGPCQQPMAKLDALAQERTDAWGDRVALVPVGIDSDAARIRSHAERRGWTHLEHFWSGAGVGTDFDAPAARAYGVSAVPEAVLVGPDGRILWRGHPDGDPVGGDLRARVERALR